MYILYITRPHKHFALEFLSCLIKDVRTILGDDDEGGGSTLVPNVNFDFRNIMTFNLVLYSSLVDCCVTHVVILKMETLQHFIGICMEFLAISRDTILNCRSEACLLGFSISCRLLLISRFYPNPEAFLNSVY